MQQTTLTVKTPGRGLINITQHIAAAVSSAKIEQGLCHVFIQHTSASLIICENADPDVQTDLENFMQRLVPDGDSLFEHTAEGPDDMPAHVRSILTQTEMTIPLDSGKLLLGTWQGIFLWEHRTQAHSRSIIVSVVA